MHLEIKDLRVHYGKIEAIKGISFHVNQGEIVTLIGANGAGKTTTLKTISGLRGVSSGSILFDGKDISKMPAHERVDLGISQAPEGRGIFPGMTVLENLEMGKFNRKNRKAEMDEDLEMVYTLFPRLKERAFQDGGTLSGGEQQRLAIYGAMGHSPKLLILDEPTVGLDDQSRSTLYSILRERMRSGAGILFTSHYAQDVAVLAHRFVSLQGEAAPAATAALFTVDGTLDLFATAALLPQGYQLLSTTNGYRIKGDDPTQLLPIANQLAASQSLNVLSFAVVSNG